MMEDPNFGLVEELMKRHKPRYRIQWDYAWEDGHVIGYWVWTCNHAAVLLKPSFYISL